MLALVLAGTASATTSGPEVQTQTVHHLGGGEQVIHAATTCDLAHVTVVTATDDVGPATGASMTNKLGKRTVVHDGQVVGRYNRVPAENMVFSPDAESLAFVAVSWGKDDFGKFQVFRDGEPMGDPGHYSASVEVGAGLGPWFSPDSQHLAWPWLWKGRWRVMVDGKSPKNQLFDGVIMDEPWTPDGRLVAVVFQGGEQSLLVDGQVVSTARAIRHVHDRPAASWARDPLAWVERSDEGERLVVGERKGQLWAAVGEVAVSEDGEKWAFEAVDEQGHQYIVVDGHARGPFDDVARLGFSATGKLAFVARSAGRWRLHVGEAVSPGFLRVQDVAFLSGGAVLMVGRNGARRHVLRGEPDADVWTEQGSYQRVFAMVGAPDGLWALSVQEMDRAAVFLQDKRQGPWVDRVIHCSVTFSPDSQHLAFAARLDGEYVMVADSTVVGGFERILCPVVVTDHQVSFVAWTSDELQRVTLDLS